MKHCLIVGQGTMPNIIRYDSLKNAYKELLELDNLLFFFKKHPSQHVKNEGYYNLFKDCIALDAYVPVEVFFSYIDGYVVGLYSVALALASRFPSIKALSLLNIIEWCDEQFKKKMEEMLIKKSNDKILFPNNFDELKRILNDK